MRITEAYRDGDIMHSCYLLIIMEKWERRFIAVQSLKKKAGASIDTNRWFAPPSTEKWYWRVCLS